MTIDRPEWGLRIAAVVTAVVLWFLFGREQLSFRTFLLPVDIKAAPAGARVVLDQAQVQLKVAGRAEAMKQINTDDARAFVDLAHDFKADKGEIQHVPVRVELNTSVNVAMREVLPSQVRVHIIPR